MADVTIPVLPALLDAQQQLSDVYEMSDAAGAQPSKKETREQIAKSVQNYINTNIRTIEVYVNSQTGLDTVGYGSIVRPYASISFALSQITDASSAKVYIIHAVGAFADTDWIVKPYINYNFNNGSYSVTNQVTLDALWILGGSVIIRDISSLDLIGGLLFDAETVNAVFANFEFKNVTIGTSSIFQVIGKAIGGTYLNASFINQFDNTLDIQLTNCYGTINNCFINDLTSLYSAPLPNLSFQLSELNITGLFEINHATTNSIEIIEQSINFGPISSYATSSTGSLIVESTGLYYDGTLTLSGTEVNYLTDVLNVTPIFLSGATSANITINARKALSAGAGINYNTVTGVISTTADTTVTYQNVYDTSVLVDGDANTDVTQGYPVTWSSVTEGMRFTSMTAAQTAALINPLNGLIVWQNDALRFAANKGTPGTPNFDQVAWISDVNAIITESSYGEMYLTDNVTYTVITATNDPVKVDGAYQTGSLAEFTHVTGTLTYTGATTKAFEINVDLSSTLNLATSDVEFYIYINGVQISKSERDVYLGDSTPAAHSVSLGCISELSTGDDIELYVSNLTSTDDILVTSLNFRATNIGGAGSSSGDQVVISWDGLTTPTAVTAGTNMSITGGVVATSAEVNVVSSWDGFTTPVAVTAGPGISIAGGSISNTAGGMDLLATLKIPTTVYPSGGGDYVLMWNAIGGLTGTNTIAAGSFGIGNTIDMEMTGINTVSITGPNADAGSLFRVKFGTFFTVVSSPIMLGNTTARTRTWYLKIKITRTASNLMLVSAAGFYYDNSQNAKPIELYFTPDAGIAYDDSVSADLTIEYNNGTSYQNYFIMKNFDIKQYI